MAEPDFVPFAIWSVVTMALLAVTGLVYRIFLRKKNEKPSS